MNPERIVPVVVGVVGIGLIGWFFWPASSPPPPPPGPAKVEPPAQTGPKFPIAQKPSEPLPTLKESDVTVLESLKGMFGADQVAKLFVPESVIRNAVATVDNLPRDKVAHQVWPLTSPAGTLKVTGKEEKLALGDNAARYKPYLDAFDKSDPAAVVGAYMHFYPLFQQSYVELGYPNGYFNDRLVEVIDHLLDAPEPKGPIKLVAPKALYEYADPDLESRSAGQKMLMRLGPQNEARVKAKLREYRKEIVAQTQAAPR